MSASSTAIVTDSTADLGSLAEQHGIAVVPLTIRFGSEEYRDGVDLPEQAFYRKLETSADTPITAAPAPGDFAAEYRRLLDAGARHIVSIHLAATLSGTVNSAAIAAREVDAEHIRVVDSRNVSAGLGMLAIDAARRARDGEPVERILAALDADIPRVRLLAAIPSLTFLARGGRIGGLRGLVGNVLKIVPILTLTDGVVKEFARVRTFQRAVEQMIAVTTQQIKDAAAVRLAIIHSMAPDLARSVADRICAAVTPQSTYICSVGPTVGTHAGPGAVGVFYIA